jgi:predicted phage tail protein
MASSRGPGRSSRHGKSQGRVTRPAKHRGANTGRYVSAEERGSYTAPTPRSTRESPRWYGFMIGALFVIGLIIIAMNYLNAVPGGTSPWYLLTGIVLIMGGFVALMRWR